MTKQILGARLGVVYTRNEHGLGAIHVDAGTNTTYIFMQADGAVTKELFYVYDDSTWQIEDALELAVNPADGKVKPVCVCPVTLADNEYAWVAVGPGYFTANSAEALDVDDVLYGHATAGKVSDTASACFLPGVSVQTAIGSATTGQFQAQIRMYAYDL